MNPKLKPYCILDPSKRWPAATYDVKPLFGLANNQAWPPEGMSVRTIQGFTCWVYPLSSGKFKLRAYCCCKLCDKPVPIGRLRQHVKVHMDRLQESQQ